MNQASKELGGVPPERVEMNLQVVEFLRKCTNLTQPEGAARPASARKSRRASTSRRCRREPKVLFIAEMEIVGDIGRAARLAGCTIRDVHSWRKTDAMFARDFVLAIVAHMRTLRSMVQEMAVQGETPEIRLRAHLLLDSESAYRDHQGRLDAHCWTKALHEFVSHAGRDVTTWEPADLSHVA